MAVRSYQELDVWKVSMDLARRCYEVTASYPKAELYGVTSQIRRAAASVPANIAEGQGRNHTKEFIHFLGCARGSLMELETFILLSHQTNLLTDEIVNELLDLSGRVSRMLSRLRQSLESRATNHAPRATNS